MKRPHLFDDINRTDTGPAAHSESSFEYLNRSGRPAVERVRNLLERWFSRFPDDGKTELRARFRSSNDYQHFGAFFELYLHELLLSLDFTVELHPTPTVAETTHPDYLVFRLGKKVFYVEATIAGMSEEEAAAKARESVVYDALDRMKSPNFFISIGLRGYPSTPPPGARIRRFLERELVKLDPDEVATQYEAGGFDALPVWHFEHEGWRLNFRAIPKSPDARGKPGVRPVGMRFYEPRYIALHLAVRSSIVSKATRYGDLDLPFVVAVNVIDPDCDKTDIANGLFGQENVTFVQNADGYVVESYSGRNPNGAWCGPSGPQNTRVSGALMAIGLSPWTIAKVTPVLWHNPWARATLPSDIWSLPQLVPDHEKGHMEECEGVNAAEVFQLGPNWPLDA